MNGSVPICEICKVIGVWIESPIKDNQHYTGYYCPKCHRIIGKEEVKVV